MNQRQFQQATGITTGLAVRWITHISAAMHEFGIITLPDEAMFLAQTGHESGGFQHIVESLNYTPQALVSTFSRRMTPQQADDLGRTSRHPARQQDIANLVYGGRMGNSSLGDGWKFRGRGLIQITGRDNYRDCGTGLAIDLIAAPEMLEQDIHAARSAAWFFASKGCLNYAGDVGKVTRIINGGTLGLAEREKRYQTALAALKV